MDGGRPRPTPREVAWPPRNRECTLTPRPRHASPDPLRMAASDFVSRKLPRLRLDPQSQHDCSIPRPLGEPLTGTPASDLSVALRD